MFIYCICNQYLVGAPFALITASIRHGLEMISLWHCWGGMEAQVSLTVAFSSSAFFGHLFLILLLTIPIDSLWGSGLVSLLASQVTLVFKKHNRPTPADDIAPQIITDCGNLTWAMSFSTLPPDSRTLVSKWNTKLALIWKEDFGPLGNSPVLLLLSPGKAPLTLSVVQEWLNKWNTTTVAKFLDVCVWWLLMPWHQPQSIPCEVHPNSWIDFAWQSHKAAVLSVGCASFSSALFPSTQLSVNMLEYSTLWTASFFGNECLWFTLLVKGVNDCLLDNCQISSLPHDCVA